MNESNKLGTNPYKFTIKGTTFDFYDLSDAIQFEQSAVEHAVKKLVALGKRSGNKSYGQDLHEAIMSLSRAQEQYNESLRQAAGRTCEAVRETNQGGIETRGTQPPRSLGGNPISRGPADPNDIEEAVKFIWRLNYTDGGPP